MRLSRLVIALAATSAFAAFSLATVMEAASGPSEPGGPSAQAAPSDKPVKKISDGLLDEIELFVATPPSPGDHAVIVRPFTTAAADLGTGDQDGEKDEQDEAKQMQEQAPKLVVDALVDALKSGPFKNAAAAPADDASSSAGTNVLIVEGTFTELDPGSRAKRYFVGFGAGKARVALAGTVKDGSGRTLATFKQRRIATGGWGGGDSIKKMTGDCRRLGEDLAKFLTTWAKDGKLD